MIDTVNVVKTSKIEDKELFFISKKRLVGKPLNITVKVDDLAVQIVY